MQGRVEDKIFLIKIFCYKSGGQKKLRQNITFQNTNMFFTF